MKKTLTLLTFLILVISCDYKSPERDRHPEIPLFSGQVLQNPEKYGLVQINEKNEDIQNLFIDNDRLILISEVGEAGISTDSLVISEYKKLSEVKKIYYKTGQDSSKPNLNPYQVYYLDGNIYSGIYRFSAPDYEPVVLDSIFLKKKEKMKFETDFADEHNHKNVLKPFEEIVIANSAHCGGGKLGPLVCPVYLSYFKIGSTKNTIMFKEREAGNRFRIIPAIGKRYLFYKAPYDSNSSLFLIK